MGYADNQAWKPVVGYEGLYEVSSAGLIRQTALRMGTRPNRIVSWHFGHDGYARVNLTRDGATHLHLVHKIVAAAYLGPDGGLDVNHKNGVRSDPRLENLEYVTRAENMAHARDVLGWNPRQGELLNDDQVRYVRSMRGKLSQRKIAREMGVSQAVVWSIQSGRRYAHVA
jgi:hypothetical protein